MVAVESFRRVLVALQACGLPNLLADQDLTQYKK